MSCQVSNTVYDTPEATFVFLAPAWHPVSCGRTIGLGDEDVAQQQEYLADSELFLSRMDALIGIATPPLHVPSRTTKPAWPKRRARA